MAELTTVARPYAKAAFQVALNDNALDDWSRMLALAAAISRHDRVRLLLQAPALTSEQVAESFIGVCDNALNDKGKNFVHLLAENKRITLFAEIARIYENLRAQQEKSLDVEVITPYEISSAVSDQLAAALKSRLQREVKLATRTDQSLIGGAVVRAGDTVIDSSVRGKLAKLTESINS
ncbi:MAG: F0F1 ATP synthase subunit delta [Gammaproteobacteria bacterium]|nr:F0F1 ATP synthase subunit delta [Gammaproteobacteria bacterium]|tara:strand:+ start:1772 stop:2308 length:537 start_codon:yes stop_codon:yes gene_type:complete